MQALTQALTDLQQQETAVHVGTPEAIEGSLATIVGDAEADERAELFEMVGDAKGLTNERLKAMIDARGEDDNLEGLRADSGKVAPPPIADARRTVRTCREA